MLSQSSYLDAKCEPALSGSHQVTQGEGTTTITVTREMALPPGIPDIARSIVGNTLKLTETQAWRHTDDGPQGELRIVVIENTAEINGTLRLIEHGDGSQLLVNANIMVRIPLFGSSLERSILGTVESVLRSEERIGQDWLAHNS